MNKSTHIKRNVFLSLSSIIFCLVQLNCAFAFDFASSPNPVGSGARAMGMGGAFIAVADDATAASWNPGGLVQLKTPEISVVGNWFHRTEDTDFANHPEASGSETVSKEDLNYFSTVYPFNFFNRNMVISLNYQKLYDFERERDFQFTDETTDKIDSFFPLFQVFHQLLFTLSLILLCILLQKKNVIMSNQAGFQPWELLTPSRLFLSFHLVLL